MPECQARVMAKPGVTNAAHLREGTCVNTSVDRTAAVKPRVRMSKLTLWVMHRLDAT